MPVRNPLLIRLILSLNWLLSSFPILMLTSIWVQSLWATMVMGRVPIRSLDDPNQLLPKDGIYQALDRIAGLISQGLGITFLAWVLVTIAAIALYLRYRRAASIPKFRIWFAPTIFFFGGLLWMLADLWVLPHPFNRLYWWLD
jgi:hypothetical protein